MNQNYTQINSTLLVIGIITPAFEGFALNENSYLKLSNKTLKSDKKAAIE